MTTPAPIYIDRPPKPIEEMTDDELTAWCQAVGDAFAVKVAAS